MAARPQLDDSCPTECSAKTIAGFEGAFVDVICMLNHYYRPKDVLCASVRGHYHFHLIPIWEREEGLWHREQTYPKGHLLEFLGFLEKQGDERAERERREQKITAETHRKQKEVLLLPDVMALRELAEFDAAEPTL